MLSALESFRTANEKSITGEDCLAGRILHKIADAVLRVARRMDGPDRDVADLESLLVLWRLGDSLAVLAANDGELLIVQISKLEVYTCQLISCHERNVGNAGWHIPASCCLRHDPSDYSFCVRYLYDARLL